MAPAGGGRLVQSFAIPPSGRCRANPGPANLGPASHVARRLAVALVFTPVIASSLTISNPRTGYAACAEPDEVLLRGHRQPGCAYLQGEQAGRSGAEGIVILDFGRPARGNLGVWDVGLWQRPHPVCVHISRRRELRKGLLPFGAPRTPCSTWLSEPTTAAGRGSRAARTGHMRLSG